MLVVRLKLNGSKARHLMIEDPIPAGAEQVESVGNLNLDYTGQDWSDWYSSREFRDNRTVFFLDYFDGDATFQYAMRVQVPGQFRVAPARAELMYRPSTQSNTASGRMSFPGSKVVEESRRVGIASGYSHSIQSVEFVHQRGDHMLKETLNSIITAARSIFRNWKSALLIAIVYAALLAVLYFFVAIREATFVQVSLTFASAVVAPVLFFVLQAMIAGETGSETSSLLRRSLTNFWKLVLITLPLIGLAILVAYLLGKAQAYFSANATEALAEIPRRVGPAREAARPIEWRAAMLSTLRYLTFGLVLPLAAIHLWLATMQEGLVSAVRKIGRYLSRAFAPQSVLVYIVGFVVFGVLPYWLLFRTIPVKNAWVELSLLVGRLAIVFALTLFGWAITVRALALLSNTEPVQPTTETT